MRRRRSIGRDREQLERQGDIAFDAQVRQHVECLEHETDGAPAQQRGRIIVELREVLALENHASRIGPIEPGEQIEQRRLADARLAHDRKVLAGTQREIDPLEDRRPIGPIALAQALEAQHLREGRGGIGHRGPRILRGIHADDGLDLEKIAQTVFAVFSAVARHLEAAERGSHVA